jgi:uncharacterized protein (TIGR00369 family)
MNLSEHNILKLYQQSNNFGDMLGMQLTVVDRGEVLYKMPIAQLHLATPQAAHGGAISALVDAALGVAALTAVCEDLKVVSTIEFKVNYLRPAIIGDVLEAKGKVISAGKRILSVECSVKNQRDEIIATASGTFNAYPAEKVYGNLLI